MKRDIFSQIYFGRLYSTEEDYNKINLCSTSFLSDAADFCQKKANENEMEILIKGIQFLAFGIKKIDEINEAKRIWERMTSSMAIRIGFEEGMRKRNLEFEKPNLLRKFYYEVDKILEIRSEEIVENKRKGEEREKIEKDKLKEELNKQRKFNTLLLENNDKLVQNVKYTQSNDKFEKVVNKSDFLNIIPTVIYPIEDGALIQKIFDHCNKEIFDCRYPTFLVCIETANFKEINIKLKNKVQYLTHRLSDIMGQMWYTDICQNMNWTKPLCSGKRDNIKDQLWTRKFENILPMQKKE